MTPENLVLIGEITKIRGLKGQLKVFPLTDYPEQFNHLNEVILFRKGKGDKMELEDSKFQGRFAFLKFEGIDTPEAAQELVGSEIYIERAHRCDLPEDHYYFDQIEGFEVVSAAGDRIGSLVDIYHFPASDVLSVDAEGVEVMIPFVKALVPEIIFDKKRIIVVDMPSLWQG